MIDFKSRKYKTWKDGMYVPLSVFDGDDHGLALVENWMRGKNVFFRGIIGNETVIGSLEYFDYWVGDSFKSEDEITRKQALYIVTGKVYD